MAAGGESIGRAYVKILADGSGFADDVEREVRANAPQIEKAGDDASKSFHSGFRKDSAKSLDDTLARMRNKLNQQSRVWEKAGEGLGKAFGRGSRNDLLNIIGGVVSAAPRFIGAMVRMGAAVVEFGRNQLARATKNAESFMDVLGNLASQGMQGLIAAAAIAAAAIQVSTAMLGPMASALVLVTGLVLALAGSLSFALVGGLVAVAGALVPFAAAIGVAALAMSGLNKKTDAFKNLKREWKDLRRELAIRVFGKDMGGLDSMTSLLRGLRPLINPVADALSNLLKSLGKTAETKEFKTLMGDLGKVLGPMAEDLGKIGGKLLLGLANAFLAAAPTVEKFIPLLEKFADWLLKISEGGKDSKLAKWFDDAWDSAVLVAGTIESIIGLVTDLFGLGKGTGDSIFTKIKEDVDKIRTWLADPKNSAAIDQWFEDAEKLYDKLRLIAIKIVEIIDKLDTPANRTILFGMLDIIANLLTGLDLVIGKTNELNTAAGESASGGFERLKQRIKEVTDGTAWDQLKTRINEATDGVAFDQLKLRAGQAKDEIVRVFTPLGAFFAGVGNSISSSVSPVWDRLKVRAGEAKDGIVKAFSGLGTKIKGAAGSIGTTLNEGWASLKTRAGQARTGVVNAFSGLAGKITAKSGSIKSSFSTWISSLPGKAKTTATSVANGFSNLSGKIITRAGSLSSRFASWTSSVPGKAKSVATSIANAFSGLASKAMDKAGSITAAIGRWASGVYGRARGVANDIVSAFSGLAGRIIDAIGTIVPRIRMPSIPRPTVTAIVKGLPGNAAGGVFNQATLGVFGEAGPEAIVPLHRPLHLVDPAVRALSAFAQGLPQPGGATAPATSGRHIEVGGITINTPTGDPRAVASEVVARMTFGSYI